MTLRLLLVTSLIAVGVTTNALEESADTGRGEYLTVQVRYVPVPEPTLLFEVRSTHSKPFSMYEADLPWGHSTSVELTFSIPSGQEACPLYTRAIDFPSDEEVTIEPGQTLEGPVRLAEWCPDIVDVLEASPVTVEWEYQPAHGRSHTTKARGSITVRRLPE